MKAIDLSVVIPCYNEAKVIRDTIQVVHRYLSEKNPSHEIIVSDDGSQDDTAEKVSSLVSQSPWLRLLKLPHQGKGGTVRQGMLESHGRLVLFMDADLSTPIEELPAFLEAAKRGAQVVIASRELPDSKLVVPQTLNRRLVGGLFRLVIRLLFGLPFRDTQCGFKLFSRRAVDTLFPKQTLKGFIFDVELLYLAKIHGFNIVDLPVKWINRLPSRVSVIGDLGKTVRDLIWLRLKFINTKGEQQ